MYTIHIHVFIQYTMYTYHTYIYISCTEVEPNEELQVIQTWHEIPGSRLPPASLVWTVPAFSSKDVARTHESQHSTKAASTKACPHELVVFWTCSA